MDRKPEGPYPARHASNSVGTDTVVAETPTKGAEVDTNDVQVVEVGSPRVGEEDTTVDVIEEATTPVEDGSVTPTGE